jgi:imidazole glycerol-phosphate synthase subunit HisH
MKIAILDYGAGNLRSVHKATLAAQGRVDFPVFCDIIHDATALESADRIILPGVGAFADCMKGLSSLPKMIDALEKAVFIDKKPFLGICVGMQLLVQEGHEHGIHTGLGWFKGKVKRFTNPKLRVPHMGWNTVKSLPNHPLFKNIMPQQSIFYYVHSYYVESALPETILATTDYDHPYPAMIGKENIIGVQFHPEKSQEVGLTFLSNFLRWQP